MICPLYVGPYIPALYIKRRSVFALSAAPPLRKVKLTVVFDGIFRAIADTAFRAAGKKRLFACFGGNHMSYAMMFLQIRRASIRIAEAVEAHRIPSNADLKILGLKPQMFVHKIR
jgi:hypothetical protein